MARSASKQSIGSDGTRFGDSEIETGVTAAHTGRLGIGSVIDGKYRIEGLLGEGGMGAVWWAHHLQLDLPVAIKLLRAGPDMKTLSERFKLEARAAARLVHPAIVRVFDIDTMESGDPFIVMELLPGENLGDLLERGRLSGVSAVQLLLPIAEALSLAHAKGIVHRDLKPANVFLAQDNERIQPKLLDFGIAKLTTPEPSGSLTDTGVSVGSPDYMSPEQARGSRDVDYRADIWSFSVVLYEAVTGSTPFEGDNYNALMRAIVEDEPAPLPVDDNLDQGLAELILWGLAKDRSQRAGSIQELGRELARWLLDRGVSEDVCGSPLGPRWITRVAQKSVPVIQLDTPEPAKPAPVAQGGTLVSARLANTALSEPHALAQSSTERASRRPPPWVLAAVALAVGGGMAWGWLGKPSLEGRAISGPVVGSVAAPAVPRAPSTEPAAEPSGIATTAAEPSGIAATAAEPSAVASALPSAPPAPSGALHSAPIGLPQQKRRDARRRAPPPSRLRPPSLGEMFTTKRTNCCKLIDVFHGLSRLPRTLHNPCCLVLGAVLGLLPVSVARADAPSSEAAAEGRRSQAKLKFDEGVKAFGEHRYTDAVTAFLQADSIEPSAPLSFNIARAFEHLDNASSALRWYRDYLRREPQAANAGEVQARVTALAATLAARGVQQLTVISTPVGASVLIDKRAAGVAPLTTELAPGAHHVRLELAGYRATEADVALDASTPQDLALRLEALPVRTTAKPATAPLPSEPSRDADHVERPFGPAPWIAFGAGGVSLLGALGFELGRRSAESAAKKAVQLDYNAHFDAMQSRQTTARVLVGVGGALIVTGGVLFVLNTPRKAGPELALRCAPSGCGLRASGSFQ